MTLAENATAPRKNWRLDIYPRIEAISHNESFDVDRHTLVQTCRFVICFRRNTFLFPIVIPDNMLIRVNPPDDYVLVADFRLIVRGYRQKFKTPSLSPSASRRVSVSSRSNAELL